MKIYKTTVAVLFVSFFVILGLFLSGGSAAQTPDKTIEQAGKTPAQTAQQAADQQPIKPAPAVKEDFYSASQNVNVKTENGGGDVAVAGANVTISGDVQGYVMAAGANVAINGPVGNDLWAAGANLIVNSPVADNAMLAGSSVIVEKDGVIGRDLRVGASVAVISGNVTRNLYIGAANAEISSEIGGNVYAYTEKLTLNPGAVIRGNLVVHSPNEPVISPQAQVLGKIDFQRTENKQSSSNAFASWIGKWFLSFLWVAVLGLCAVWFSTVWTNRVADVIKTQTGRSFLVGLVAVLVVPILFILLLVTVVGMPIAFLLGAMSLVALLLSSVFVSYLVGDLVLKQAKLWEGSNVLKIVFGALIITLVMALPWIGWIAKLAVVFFGVGAFMLERRDLFRRMREQGLA